MLERGADAGNSLDQYMLSVKNPTILGFYWGIFATWWFGAGLGVPVSIAARVGNSPKINAKQLIKPLGAGLGFLGGTAFLAGLYGYIQSKRDKISFFSIHSGNTPYEARHRYIADAYAHTAGYGAGALVAIGVFTWTLYTRYQMQQEENMLAEINEADNNIDNDMIRI